MCGAKRVTHDIHEDWASQDSAALRMDVNYVMENGAEFSIPTLTVMRFRDGKIAEFLIFQDPAPLEAAQAG